MSNPTRSDIIKDWSDKLRNHFVVLPRKVGKGFNFHRGGVWPKKKVVSPEQQTLATAAHRDVYAALLTGGDVTHASPEAVLALADLFGKLVKQNAKGEWKLSQVNDLKDKLKGITASFEYQTVQEISKKTTTVQISGKKSDMVIVDDVLADKEDAVQALRDFYFNVEHSKPRFSPIALSGSILDHAFHTKK